MLQIHNVKIFSEAITRAKSVADILNVQQCLVFTPDEDKPGAATIVCKTCADYKADMKIYSAAGIFGLPNVDIDERLNDLHRTNKWFSNFRHNVKEHLITKIHTTAVDHHQQVATRRKSSADKNFLAAKTVVRTVYLSAKLGDSFNTITARLANLFMAGAEIGQKNHSYALPPEVIDEIAGLIENSMSNFLVMKLLQTGEHPPFGLITDKITSGQRTRQMVSLRTVNLSTDIDDPDCPLIINLYVGHPVCDDKSGKGLAADLKELLKTQCGLLSRDIKASFKGIGVDGEYLNLHILMHFLDENLITEDREKYFEIWDPAHVIERAVLDGFKRSPILKKHVSWLQEIIKSVQYGNSYEELLKAANELHMTLLKPKIFKTKKFVVDCEKVYVAFFRNYKAIAAALQQLVPDSTAETCLRHMTDKHFLLSASFMACICSILASSSSEFQRFDGLVNDLFNNYTVLIEQLNEIKALLIKQDVKGYSPLKRFADMLTEIDKGEHQGVPIIGRNSILRHYQPLITENMFSKLDNYVSAIQSGFTKRMAGAIENQRLASYAGFLNVLMGSIVPHTFSITFDPVLIGEILRIPATTVQNYLEKFCKLIGGLPSKCKSSFNKAIRSVLIDPLLYRDLPEKFLAGFIEILAIPVSEAIAETQGSAIDHLKLRYCNTDANYNRLQNELKIKLMGPPPCTDSAERLIAAVARKMCGKHNFLTTHGKMGSAITHVRDKKYSLPFSF